MSRIKVFDGKNWVDKQEAFKVRTGNSWRKGIVKRWTGSNWEEISTIVRTKTWDATWTQSYWGWNDAKAADRGGNRLYQGRYGAPDTQTRGDVGIQKGMAGFNDADMRSSLSGAKILKVEVYLHCAWWWYWAGGTAIVGLHNASGWQSKWSQTNNDIARQAFGSRSEGHWFTLPTYAGELLRDGKAKGITTFANSDQEQWYGYFYGTQGGDKKPKIRITYEK